MFVTIHLIFALIRVHLRLINALLLLPVIRVRAVFAFVMFP